MTKRNSPRPDNTKAVPAKAKNAAPNGEPAATGTAMLPGPERGNPTQEIVGAIFQNDSVMREAIAGNLRERSIERKAFTTRANDAFANFQPTKYPSDASDARPRPNYVNPGESVTPVQHEVIKRGIEAIRKSTTPRSLRLVESADLKALVKEAPENDQSIVGTITHTDFMSYLEAKTKVRTFVARDNAITICKAEIEAERWMKKIMASSKFSVDDFLDLPSLAGQLKKPKRAVDTWLAGQLSPATQTALSNYRGQGSDPAALQTGLVQDFNRIIGGPSIYASLSAAGVDLREETEKLHSQKPQGDDLVRLNRLLLEDAYPLELSRASNEPAPGDNKNVGGSARDASQLTAAQMVKENVDLQMHTATSPESQLSYNVPDRSKQMDQVRTNIDTFELRAGPSDVTSYHDFHNLQIAFEDVWTEMFDAKVGNLGKQLFEEYVKLKSATGVDDAPDRSINTIDDLRLLMNEIRDFSRITVDSIPTALQPATGGGDKQNGSGNVVTDVVNVVNAVVNPAGALIDFVMKAFSGHEGALTWDSFKTNLPLGDIISYTIEPDKLPKSIIEIVLIAGPNSSGHVGLIYEDKKTKAQWPIQTADRGIPATLSLAAVFGQDGLVHFRRTTSPLIVNGVYNLPIDSNTIKPGTRVTFTWLKDG